jgi:hypothetical protein
MNLVSRSDAVIRLPDFPSSLAGANPAAGVGMRRFGIFESDLTVDFTSGDTPAVITRILEHCAIDADNRLPGDFFRGLSVGKRLECLLALAAGEKRVPFNFPFRCAGCEQELEIELTLDEIAEMQGEADRSEIVEVSIGARSLLFRKPSGRDQEHWAGMLFRDETDAARAMIGTLAVDPEIAEGLGAKELGLIDAAMDEADPLVNFLCRIDCSECEAPNEFLIDLTAVALERLSRLQQQLIVMVHKLASHYHWSEKEVFEVPHRRRKQYLDLIAAGR